MALFSQSHQEIVQHWAEELIADGIDVVLNNFCHCLMKLIKIILINA